MTDLSRRQALVGAGAVVAAATLPAVAVSKGSINITKLEQWGQIPRPLTTRIDPEVLRILRDSSPIREWISFSDD